MAARKTAGSRAKAGIAADVGTEAAIRYMAALVHARKAEIETVRALILGADPRVTESVKWNAPSFSIADHFATMRLHPKDSVQIVFHTGAKVRPDAKAMTIDDPAGLLKWAAKDRAQATLADASDLEAKRSALVSIVKQWIAQL